MCSLLKQSRRWPNPLLLKLRSRSKIRCPPNKTPKMRLLSQSKPKKRLHQKEPQRGREAARRLLHALSLPNSPLNPSAKLRRRRRARARPPPRRP